MILFSDYHRVLDSYTQLTKRLDEVIIENTNMKEKLLYAEDRLTKAEEEAKSLDLLNKDLGSQVQHLLWLKYNAEHGTSIGGRSHHAGFTGNDVISEHLVTVDSIEDMQNKYSQLLRVTRKLTEDMESIETRSIGGTTSMKTSLDAANRELESLREARVRTEEMVLTLVQQRDMYRAMVNETDKSGYSSDLKQITDESSQTPRKSAGQDASTPHKYHELQSKYNILNDESIRLKERGSRLEDQLSVMNEMLDKCQTELNTFRKEASFSAAEAKFQTERASRFEESMKISQQTIETQNARRAEVETLNVNQQKEIRLLNDKLLQMTNDLRQTQDQMKRLEIKVEVSSAAEKRLQERIEDLRKENERQASLTESMRRIEVGLSGRIEDEKKSLERERDSLVKTVENLRKEAQNASLVYDQKIRSLDEDVRSSREKLEEKIREYTAVKEDLLREQGLSRAAQERGSVLEQQLSMAQERLGTIQGSNTLDLVVVADAKQNEFALSRALSEIENLRDQLASAGEHEEKYRQISLASEEILRQLREDSSRERKKLEEQVNISKQEFAKYKEDHEGSGVLNLVLELEQTREKMLGIEKEHTANIAGLKTEVEIANASAAQALAQMENLNKDVLKYQQAARSANANYERELQLHAHDAAELRNTEIELDKVRAELAAASQRLADVSADILSKDKTFEEERIRNAREVRELTDLVSSLRRTNDISESQLKLYTDKFDRSEVTLPKSSESDGSASDEVLEYRTQLSELHEALHLRRQERHTLELKLSASDLEKNRLQDKLFSIQRDLDETRSMLNKELEKKSTIRDDSAYAKLMAEVTQLNILRESNENLRSERDQLSKINSDLEKTLTALREEVSPLQHQVKILEAEKEALSAEVTHHSSIASSLKDRLDTLFKRYSVVDPEEHKQSIAEIEVLKQKIAKLDAELVQERQLIENKDRDFAALDAELQQTRQRVDTKDKNLDRFREQFTKFKEKMAATEERNRSLEETIATLTKERGDAVAEKEKERAKNESLSAILRKRNLAPTSSATSATASATDTSAQAATTNVASVAGTTVGSSSEGMSKEEAEKEKRRLLMEQRKKKLEAEAAQKALSNTSTTEALSSAPVTVALVSSTPAAAPVSDGATAVASDAVSQVKCKFFLKGNCGKGANCNFLHDEPTTAASGISTDASATPMEVSIPRSTSIERMNSVASSTSMEHADSVDQKSGSASPFTKSTNVVPKAGSASPLLNPTASAFIPGALKRKTVASIESETLTSSTSVSDFFCSSTVI